MINDHGNSVDEIIRAERIDATTSTSGAFGLGRGLSPDVC